jgi:hypothetical protein
MPENEKAPKILETRAREPAKVTADGQTTVNAFGAKSRLIISSLFWLLIFGAVAYWLFAPHNRAQVFLQSSGQPPRQLTGIVLFKGAPVSNGTVYLFFEDPRKDLYLASAIFSVTEHGEFVTSANESSVFKDSNEEPQPLRVTATFTGQKQEQKKDKVPIPVTGKATLYLNYPAAAGKLKIWSLAIISTVLSIGLITLFVGELTQRKAQILFWITYLMSFLSLAVPIWGVAAVSKSDPVVDMMLKAPIGLIKGTARGVERPQWLVNIGGAVMEAKEPPAKKELVRSPARKVPAKEEEIGRPSPVDAGIFLSPSPTPQQSATPTVSPSPTPQQSPTPTPQENMGTDEPRQIPGFAMVRGGLAVPFYVIILAMLGAGINMTKRVPEIQEKYNTDVLPAPTDSIPVAALKAIMMPFGSTQSSSKTQEQKKVVAGIRKNLIDNYMGLISAPFLGIAVYYLLQAIATNIAEPVLVVVSFATGFISDRVITAITSLASKAITGGATDEEKRAAEEEKRVAEQKKRAAEEEKRVAEQKKGATGEQ